MQLKLVTRDQNIANSPGKEIKQNALSHWKKINPKGNITTKYIVHKHKNTGTRCKSIRISGLQCTEVHSINSVIASASFKLFCCKVFVQYSLRMCAKTIFLKTQETATKYKVNIYFKIFLK